MRAGLLAFAWRNQQDLGNGDGARAGEAEPAGRGMHGRRRRLEEPSRGGGLRRGHIGRPAGPGASASWADRRISLRSRCMHASMIHRLPERKCMQ
jgi:hypothetical protein